MENTISQAEFRANYKRTGVQRSEIFGGRKALMEEMYETAPIYCDMSYYVDCQTLHRVIKENGTFVCGTYKNFENWRECHYYYEHADKNGNKVWLMVGGKYE